MFLTTASKLLRILLPRHATVSVEFLAKIAEENALRCQTLCFENGPYRKVHRIWIWGAARPKNRRRNVHRVFALKGSLADQH